jgi:P4 family phage/plasmid primase-like protien
MNIPLPDDIVYGKYTQGLGEYDKRVEEGDMRRMTRKEFERLHKDGLITSVTKEQFEEFESIRTKNMEEATKIAATMKAGRERLLERMAINNKQSRDEVSEQIVQQILAAEHIYTTQDDREPEMWSYRDGVYIPQAKSMIKECTRQILGEAYTTHFAHEVIAKIQADTFIDQNDFFNNNKVDEVCVENGILNVITRALRPHTPDEIFFNKLPVTYNPAAVCPAFRAHLDAVLKFPTDAPVIGEIFGFTLRKEYRPEKCAMFIGEGRNGKSKTLEVLKMMLGPENVCNIPLHQFETDPYATGELLNKLACISVETTDQMIEDTSRIKALTGRDGISCQRKYKPMIHFKNYAKLIYGTNALPRSKDTSDGFFSRWVMLEFPYYFDTAENIAKTPEKDRQRMKVKDDDIVAKLTTPEELSGILNFALDGLERLMKTGDFSHARTNTETRELWEKKSDSFMAFVKEYVEEDFESTIPKAEMTSAYLAFCKISRLKDVSTKHIKAVMERVFSSTETRIGPSQDSRKLHWDGVKWKKSPPKIEKEKPPEEDKKQMNLGEVYVEILPQKENLEVDQGREGKEGRPCISLGSFSSGAVVGTPVPTLPSLPSPITPPPEEPLKVAQTPQVFLGGDKAGKAGDVPREKYEFLFAAKLMQEYLTDGMIFDLEDYRNLCLEDGITKEQFARIYTQLRERGFLFNPKGERSVMRCPGAREVTLGQ